MIQQFARSQGPVLGFKLTQHLSAQDYESLTPLVDSALARHGRVRILLHFDHLNGWDLASFWRELRFTAQHFADVERFAIVGEARRDEWFAKLAKPFTVAEIRYFDGSELGAAWRWIEDETPRHQPALTDPLDDPDPVRPVMST
jgi:hypothetical protein